MGLRMKSYGGSLKNPIFRGWFMKNQYIWGNCLKKEAWAVYRFKWGGGGGGSKRGGGSGFPYWRDGGGESPHQLKICSFPTHLEKPLPSRLHSLHQIFIPLPKASRCAAYHMSKTTTSFIFHCL